MVNFARCKVLGANVLRGPKQIPWDGKLKYDYQLWIDSDIVFDTNKFWQLCDMALPADAVKEDGSTDPEKEKQIAAGWYATEDGSTTSVAHWLEEDDFRKNGGVMNHETVETISKRRKPFTVDYTGFGWVLIKHGVFEALEYPWFAPKMQVFESGDVQDMCGEDVSFCLDAQDADLRFGAILVFVQGTKRLVLFKINKQLKTEELWGLASEILTELSRRETKESVKNKLEKLL